MHCSCQPRASFIKACAERVLNARTHSKVGINQTHACTPAWHEPPTCLCTNRHIYWSKQLHRLFQSPFLVNSIHLIDPISLNMGLLVAGKNIATKDKGSDAEVPLTGPQLNQTVIWLVNGQSISQSVHHFGPYWNISTTLDNLFFQYRHLWLLTFPLVPQWCWHLWFRVKYLHNY